MAPRSTNNQSDFTALRPLLTNGELSELQQMLGIKFRNPKLLRQAFTHRSYLNEARVAGLGHNERLEFLGDKVLGFTVAQYLFRQYGDYPEGQLTSLQSALVNTKMLGEIAEELEFAHFLRMSRGEDRAFRNHHRSRNYILGSAFEALIGAIYLDRGPGTVELFLLEVLLPKLPDIIDAESYIDPKSQFQEVAQDRLHITPRYEVLDEEGPDHERKFTVGAFLDQRLVGKGVGFSKSEAQQQAAKNALFEEFQISFE